jgi:hypothetical protein
MKCHNLRGFTIENKLFWYGTINKMKWEKQSTDLWSEIARKSKVIIDIGANTEYYSLIAKAINSNSKVFGFEPIPHIYKWYVENCKINSFEINYLNEFRPSMLLEVLSDEAGTEINQLLIPMKYQFFKLCITDLPTKVEQISANSSFNFYVCQKEVA